MRSSSTGAKPMARAQRDSGDRLPDSSTITALRRPSSRTRMIAASAPRAAQAATPSAHRGRPTRRAKARASSASEASARTSVARIQSGRSRAWSSRVGRRAAMARRVRATRRAGRVPTGPGAGSRRVGPASGPASSAPASAEASASSVPTYVAHGPDRSGASTADRSRAAYEGSARRWSAATSASSSSGGTSRPSTPSRTWAPKVPTSEASTGRPWLRPSRTFCEAVAVR